MESSENRRDSVGFVDYVLVVIRGRKTILLSFLFFTVFSVILSLSLPKKYKATAIVMPPTTKQNPLAGFSLNIPLGGLSSLLSGTTAETNILISILKSRNIAANTVNKFNLVKRYDSKSIDDAIRTFRKKLSVEEDEEGAVRIEFLAETGYFHPQNQEEEAKVLCAQVVNFVVDDLDRINTELQTRQAKSYRIFIGERYDQNKRDLHELELEMKKFSETYGMISLPEQVVAAVTAAAKLKSDYIIKEIELKAMKNVLQPHNSEIMIKEVELKEMRNKLNEFKFGNLEEDSIQILPTFATAPKLGLNYVRLKREIEVQNVIYEYLTQQYEQAKLQEAKDTPTIQILDEAVVPQRRSSPIRSLVVAVFALIGILIGIFLASIREYFNQLAKADPEKYNTIVSVLNDARRDLFDRKSGKS